VSEDGAAAIVWIAWDSFDQVFVALGIEESELLVLHVSIAMMIVYINVSE
jgi:hypothetical protein